MFEKGYLTKAQHDSEVKLYEAIKARIDSDIASAHDRVEWAKKMYEKGYVSKATYEQAILKHYNALKARLSEGGLSPRVLEHYEYLKSSLEGQPAKPGADGQGSTPNSTPKDSAHSLDAADGVKPKNGATLPGDATDRAKPKNNTTRSRDTTDEAKPF